MKKIAPDFKNKDTLKDKFWCAMCDAGMSFPIPVSQANLSETIRIR